MHIKNKFNKIRAKEISEQIYTLITSQPTLTNRSKKQICHWILNGQMYIACHKDKVVGFIVNEPIDLKYSEIKSWFVTPSYRNQNIGSKLLVTASKDTKFNYLLSTFEKSSIKNLSKHHFQEIQYLDLPLSTAIRLLLSKHLTSIVKHLFTKKSYLLCKYANN